MFVPGVPAVGIGEQHPAGVNVIKPIVFTCRISENGPKGEREREAGGCCSSSGHRGPLRISQSPHRKRPEYDQAVKISDQVLSVAPGDEDAIRCKVVALIKNDNVDKALLAIEGSPHKSSTEFIFFKFCRIGQESLMEENLANEDIEIELAPIAVQLAYVQQILGNTQEAFESYTNIIKSNLADESSLAVATNNLTALKGPKDVADGLR